MFYYSTTRWLPALVFLIGAAATAGSPAWAQHHGGHHYGGHGFGHGFGGFGHSGFGHHYSPFYYGGYSGLGDGSYGYRSWPQSYTPRVYTYSGPPTVYMALPTGGTPDSYAATSPSIDATAAGLSYKTHAESAFRTHHYEEAIDWAKRAAKMMPRDGRLFLLLSQIHLAVGEYRDAAGAARLGMSLLPTEDWGYIVKNFRNYYHDTDYVAQVRRLGQFSAEHPNHADSHFLLGYHWVFLGHPNAANRELTKAAELNPRDEWATRLLAVVDGPVPQPRPIPPEPISEIGRAVQQECRDRSRMPSSA
eukprot:TRINITY_DN901_c0_g1_i2.p1 TRINITY_DN901_c0_g1~~TRINITY_DN901_c0_g1_i2.p1  ORF type:complete len:305 (-),score=51.27 TRINITY_DN901_c0_g1_i2:21-935(-)